VIELIDSRDYLTGSHLERAERALELIVPRVVENPRYKADAENWDVNMVLLSSQLHDVGKIAISDSILRKPGSLTPEEFETMKAHTTFGVQVIDKIAGKDEDSNFLHYAKVFAGTHHERWDGAGYPGGLAGEKIPLLGRIMAIADVYEALTSERSYKPAFSHEKSVSIIMQERGTRFDPDLADIFSNVADEVNMKLHS
jgi:putative two-component system response regulator